MAIDTRDKRTSAVMPGLPFRAVLPTADAAVAQADRQFVPWWYSGILAASSTPSAVLAPVIRVPFRDAVAVVEYQTDVIRVPYRDTVIRPED